MLLEMNAESEQQIVEAEDSHFENDLKQGINQEMVTKRVQLVMPAEATQEEIDQEINVLKSQMQSEYKSQLGHIETIIERVDVMEDTEDGATKQGLPDNSQAVFVLPDSQEASPVSDRLITIAGRQVPQSQAEMIKQLVQDNMKQIYDKFSQESSAKNKDGKVRPASDDSGAAKQRIEMTPTIIELNSRLENKVIAVKATETTAQTHEEDDTDEHSTEEVDRSKGKVQEVANKITTTKVKFGLGDIPIRPQRPSRIDSPRKELSESNSNGKITTTKVKFGLGGIPINLDRSQGNNSRNRERSTSPDRKSVV